ncbi:MAG: FHA domain-containing protein [Planctomycetota bacterium]|nr:FHA domain-containing protein [Planctomycetota bacterium]
MPHHLAFLVVEGRERGREIPVPQEGGSIGSSSMAAIVLQDDGIQAFHCVIGFDQGRVFIADERAAGLRVNEQAFKKCTLRPGDVVELGRCKLRVMGTGPAQAGVPESLPLPQEEQESPEAGWPPELTRESPGDETPLMGVLPLPIAPPPRAGTPVVPPPAPTLDKPLLVASRSRPTRWWPYSLAALVVVLLGLGTYWRLVRRPVVMRDMSRGVVIRPGRTADTPELIVDPFPNDRPPSTNEQLAAIARKTPPPEAKKVERPVVPPPPAPVEAPVMGKEILPQVGYGQKPPESAFRVDRLGNIPNAAGLGKYLYGTQSPRLDNPPTFLVNATGPCKLSLSIGKINKWAGARLEFVLDDKVVPMVTLPPAKGDDNKVGQAFDLDIPKGEHRVMVRNVGKDWASVEWYKFSGPLGD